MHLGEGVCLWGEILPAPFSEQILTAPGRAKLQQLSVHVVGPCASAQAGTLWAPYSLPAELGMAPGPCWQGMEAHWGPVLKARPLCTPCWHSCLPHIWAGAALPAHRSRELCHEVTCPPQGTGGLFGCLLGFGLGTLLFGFFFPLVVCRLTCVWIKLEGGELPSFSLFPK